MSDVVWMLLRWTYVVGVIFTAGREMESCRRSVKTFGCTCWHVAAGLGWPGYVGMKLVLRAVNSPFDHGE